MDFREYAKRITFKTAQPYDPIYSLEALNVDLPENQTWGDAIYKREGHTRLCDLMNMPRMSTYAIACLINKAVKDMAGDQSYVNVGVWHGFSLLSGMLGNADKKCIGIDNFSEFGGPRMEFRRRYLDARSDKHQFYEMDYRQYFKNVQKPEEKIGFYFYDGAHDYQNQLDGLKIAEPFLTDDALIMVDDTNWPDPYRATLDFMAGSVFKYEVILDKKTSGNCHPTWWNGIFVLQRCGRKQPNVT